MHVSRNSHKWYLDFSMGTQTLVSYKSLWLLPVSLRLMRILSRFLIATGRSIEFLKAFSHGFFELLKGKISRLSWIGMRKVCGIERGVSALTVLLIGSMSAKYAKNSSRAITGSWTSPNFRPCAKGNRKVSVIPPAPPALICFRQYRKRTSYSRTRLWPGVLLRSRVLPLGTDTAEGKNPRKTLIDSVARYGWTYLIFERVSSAGTSSSSEDH